MAIRETKADVAAREKAADLSAREKAEAIEGATLPTPFSVFEQRLASVEVAMNKLTGRLDAAILIPEDHAKRLTAIEKLLRSHAETIGSVKQKP